MSIPVTLITNDDGIDSPGLHALASVAVDLGHEVIVAAPAWEQSGASASIIASEGGAVTAAGGHGRIRVEQRTIPGLEVPAFAVHAAPALIVMLAAHAAFGPRPDLVLSGINHGANVGHAILHSGTVGAALTAGLNGLRGLAVSLGVGLTGGTPHWETAARVARPVVEALPLRSVGTVVNLNVPNLPNLPEASAGDALELVETPLAPFGIVQGTMAVREGDNLVLSITDSGEDAPAGSDVARLALGSATVTAVFGVGEAVERVLPLTQTPARVIRRPRSRRSDRAR